MADDTTIFGIDAAAGHPERSLALSYVPRLAREPVVALFALDQTLAKLTLGTRDPLVAQLRLAWWREALDGSLERGAPAQPILQILRAHRIDREALAAMVDGWEALLDGEGDVDLPRFADRRGQLFGLAAAIVGARDDVAAAGQGWVLADLARITANENLRQRAGLAAGPLLSSAQKQRWSREGRALGALVLIAALDLHSALAPGAPTRVMRLAWHRLTGR